MIGSKRKFSESEYLFKQLPNLYGKVLKRKDTDGLSYH